MSGVWQHLDAYLANKFRLMSRYFDVVGYTMVKSFYPADIDKLFAVFRKRSAVVEPCFQFDLEAAKSAYDTVIVVPLPQVNP